MEYLYRAKGKVVLKLASTAAPSPVAGCPLPAL